MKDGKELLLPKTAEAPIKVGNDEYIKEYDPLVDSSTLYATGNYKEMLDRLHQTGYIYIRGLVDSDACYKARNKFLEETSRSNHSFESHSSVLVDIQSGNNLYFKKKAKNQAKIDHWKEFSKSKEVKNVFLNPNLVCFVKDLFFFCKPKILSNETWIRAVSKGIGAISHCDYFYYRLNTNISLHPVLKEVNICVILMN